MVTCTAHFFKLPVSQDSVCECLFCCIVILVKLIFLREVSIQEAMTIMKTMSSGECEIKPLPKKVNVSLPLPASRR